MKIENLKFKAEKSSLFFGIKLGNLLGNLDICCEDLKGILIFFSEDLKKKVQNFPTMGSEWDYDRASQ